ncbi:3'(2'),5'-bisphosphate nucleotidase CysQ [Candidatus Woesearchaeota archaeon]|nr:3'(2'),5'-bisphosphate nucleotidase CysQ [Candidatus Woesearchaeota archaeon]
MTSADIKSEEYILKRLSKDFPNYSILSEEKGRIENNTSRIWMVDPLDGTKDFKNGGTGFSIMIGLCQDGKPVLGVVYAPAKNLLYFSEKGHGSYVRIDGKDHRLNVSSKKYLKDAIMVTRIPHGEKREDDKLTDFFEVKEKIPESSVGIKLGLIAECKADFHISSNARASKWDTCAPQIILEEAGGKVTNLYGNTLNYKQKPSKWGIPFIASNGAIHNAVIKEIEKYMEKNK